MRRSNIYVVHSGDRWAVKLEGRNVVERFGRKAHALRAAIRAAQEIWVEEGVPTGVRVQVGRGRWEDALEPGEHSLPIAS